MGRFPSGGGGGPTLEQVTPQAQTLVFDIPEFTDNTPGSHSSNLIDLEDYTFVFYNTIQIEDLNGNTGVMMPGTAFWQGDGTPGSSYMPVEIPDGPTNISSDFQSNTNRSIETPGDRQIGMLFQNMGMSGLTLRLRITVEVKLKEL